MELTKKERTIKYGVYAAVLLLAALLQNVLSLRFSIGSAHCLIVVPTAVLLGINEDEKTAALFGLLGGAVLDMTSAQTKGFNSIYLMLACYLASVLVTFIFRSTPVYDLLAAALAVIGYCALYWLCFVLIGGSEGAGTALVRFYLPTAVYTILVAPLLRLALKPLEKRLNKTETIHE